MTTLAPDLLDHLEGYPRAVIAYAGPDGYPMKVVSEVVVDRRDGSIALTSSVELPEEAAEVELLFSHVRPQPGIGYDQRRYVNVWGRLRRDGDRLVVEPERTSGWDEQELPFVSYCERNVGRAHRYLERLSAERGEPVRPYLPLRWRLFLATRVPFLTATLVPVLLGAVVARSHGHSAWWLTMLALAGAVCIHLGLNVANDVFDVDSGADPANISPTPFSGGSRVVLYGLASQRWMRGLAAGFFVVGSTIGVVLAATRSIEILWLGLAGVFLSIFYTAPPIKLVHRGLGDVAVALGFGPIMTLGAYAVVAQRLSAEAVFASIPVGILVMLILYVNQVPDRRGDEMAGKRTLAVRFGRRAVIAGYLVSVVLAFGAIVLGAVSGILPAWTLLALLPAPLAWRVYRGLVVHYDQPYALVPALGANIAVHLLTGLGLIAAYVIAIATGG